MESKIIFLGTGGDAIVVGKQIRASGGIIFMHEGYQFHIDPGPGASLRARQFNVNPRNNTAIFSTKNTINHAGGLNEIIHAMTHDGLDKMGVVIGSNSVINGSEQSEPFLNRRFKNSVERFITLKAGQKVGINSIEVRAIKAFSSDLDAIGLKFFTSKFCLTYSSDTAYDAHLLEEYSGSNILILNVPYPLDSKKTEQLNLSDCIKIINHIKPKLAILTHFGVKLLSADPLYESREVQKQTDCEVLAAKDGMVVNPSDYSASIIQKTLNVFPVSK